MSPLAQFFLMPLFHYKSAINLFLFLRKKGKPPSSLNKLTYGRPVVAMTRIRFLRGAILLLLRPQSLAVTFWGIFELIINESRGHSLYSFISFSRASRSRLSPALAPLACSCSPLSPGKPVEEAGCDKRLLHPVTSGLLPMLHSDWLSYY